MKRGGVLMDDLHRSCDQVQSANASFAWAQQWVTPATEWCHAIVCVLVQQRGWTLPGKKACCMRIASSCSSDLLPAHAPPSPPPPQWGCAFKNMKSRSCYCKCPWIKDEAEKVPVAHRIDWNGFSICVSSESMQVSLPERGPGHQPLVNFWSRFALIGPSYTSERQNMQSRFHQRCFCLPEMKFNVISFHRSWISHSRLLKSPWQAAERRPGLRNFKSRL